MARTTEADIFAKMVESLRIAAECAEALATNDVKGRDYHTLVDCLKDVEGCCIQAATWREDTRWLPLGRLIAECHQRAGNWLRPQVHVSRLTKIKLAPKHRNEMFVMLAANLRELKRGMESLKDTKTGRVGMILPTAPAAERRIGAPVQVLLPQRIREQGGLILPKTVN